jgi:hypothetical protein
MFVRSEVLSTMALKATYYLLRCNSVNFGWSLPKFRRKVLPPCLGSKSKPVSCFGYLSAPVMEKFVTSTRQHTLPYSPASVSQARNMLTEDRGSRVLRKVSTLIPEYTVLHPKRQHSSWPIVLHCRILYCIWKQPISLSVCLSVRPSPKSVRLPTCLLTHQPQKMFGLEREEVTGSLR